MRNQEAPGIIRVDLSDIGSNINLRVLTKRGTERIPGQTASRGNIYDIGSHKKISGAQLHTNTVAGNIDNVERITCSLRSPVVACERKGAGNVVGEAASFL